MSKKKKETAVESTEPKVEKVVSEIPTTTETATAANPSEDSAEPDTSKELKTQMTFAEAEAEMDKGHPVKLPEWGGFWFKNTITGEILVMTKDNELLHTPHEEYKERNDWEIIEATPEQYSLLEEHFANFDAKQDYNSLTAVAVNYGAGTTFRKLDDEISIETLEERTSVPIDVPASAQFLMSNGQVFDYAESRLTQQFELEILESLK